MARYNEILVGRYNRWLQKLLGIKGEPPAPQLSTEIQPGIIFPAGNEEAYLQSWNRYGRSATVGPTAAVTSAHRLRNPTGSNVIAVLELLMVTTTVPDVAVNLFLGTAAADLSGIVSGAGGRWDPRGNDAPVMILSNQTTGNTNPTGPIRISFNLAANGSSPIFPVTDQQEIVLLPGDALQFTSSVVNTQLTAAFWWRERFLEDSERA